LNILCIFFIGKFSQRFELRSRQVAKKRQSTIARTTIYTFGLSCASLVKHCSRQTPVVNKSPRRRHFACRIALTSSTTLDRRRSNRTLRLISSIFMPPPVTPQMTPSQVVPPRINSLKIQSTGEGFSGDEDFVEPRPISNLKRNTKSSKAHGHSDLQLA
jgi:hypothetical protein